MLVLTNIKYAHAQQVPDTTINLKADTIKVDSVLAKDSLTSKKDSVAKNNLEERLGIKISPDALPNVVTAEASDSAVLNMSENMFELYGSAKVSFEEMKLSAHKVSYQQSKNIVIAALSEDSAIAAKGKPEFTQGQEKFTYDSLQYNFKSKRAIVRNAHSQYGEGFVISEQVKRNPDQSIYGLHSVYTTCALDEPHFGIYAQKIKLIPNRIVASGPANIRIEKIPTPLFLPFGLFPITQGQRSGFKIPTYTIDEQRGLGLLNGGYYFSISDKVDLLAEANFFTRGSWASNLFSQYANRYRYNGALSFRYAYNKYGETYESNSKIVKDFNIQWLHQSDAKSRPGVSFSAKVDAGTSTYNANNSFVANQILQNQYQSNITYTKRWQNKPISLTVGANHSQNTQSRLVNVTLPSVSFFVNGFNPFQSKKRVGERWYDKITVQYTFDARNKMQFYDTSFSFSKLSFDQMINGAQHSVPISASYNILRFVKMTMKANYKEYWMTRRMYKYYDIANARLDTNTYRNFYTARDFDASISFYTQIFGMKMFKKGSKIAGIRHVISPDVSLGYVPDYAAAPFYYGYRTRLDATGAPTYQSAYEGNEFIPGLNQFGNMRSAVGFGLDNNLQVKVRSGKDTSGFKNIRLIDNFRINGSYNLAADSFNWSNFNMSFTTMLFNVVNMNANASFDPYAFDYQNGRRSRDLQWNGHGGLVRFQNANVGLSASLNGKKKENRAASGSDEYRRLMMYGRYDDYVDFNIPFNMTVAYSLSLTKQYSAFSKRDTMVVSQHYMELNTDVNITSRWKVGVNTGFNLISNELQLTSINIYRDMHCWELRMSTVPFGPRKNYYFTLQVKASVLQDLKLVRRKDYTEAISR